MKRTPPFLAAVLLASGLAWGAKQKIILRLREPLRAEAVKIKVPELSTAKGETRDLETLLQLGGVPKPETKTVTQQAMKLNMLLRSVGKNSVQVTLLLPQPGYVQIFLLDFYGKNQGTILDGPMPAGAHVLNPVPLKDGEHHGINFLTLKLNGKVAMKKVMTKVK